ncbi:MAG: hypothetical protein O9313_14760 [Acetobacteraceae bacterium]|nr:hypothetical protein [Acetobacteraceae bacterium]
MSTPAPKAMTREEAQSAREDVASFAALGASVPFTSPRLLGARIRLEPSGRGFELILVNPAQTRGSYVMPWRALPDIGAPSMFDLRLWETLSALKDIHPTAIRHEALKVASEGTAGRLVAQAARAALADEQRNQERLMRQFLAQLAGGAPASLQAEAAPNADEQRIQTVQPPAQALDPALMESLGALAATIACLGPSGSAEKAPFIRLKEEILDMREAFLAAADKRETGDEASVMRFLSDAAETLLHYVDLAWAETDARLGDMVELLSRPRINAVKILERARRVEWLLDGWPILVALWHRTPNELRHVIAWDMAALLPPIPREVHDWFAAEKTKKAPERLTRIISQGTDWRTGRNIEITARNEGLIGFTLNYENRMSGAGLQPGVGKRRIRINKYSGGGAKRSTGSEFQDGLRKQSPADGANVDGLAANLSNASDENILRIMAMIDRLPDRSRLDALLNDIRPRLAQLRPPRPLTVMRLLFLPLSGALVDRAAWRQDPATIPRAALRPIFTLLRDLPNGPLTEAETAPPQALFTDLDLVENLGRPVWEAAARLCEKITPGSRWADAGFTPEDFRSMTRLAAGVWRHAGPIWGVLRQGVAPVSADTLRSALSGPAGEGPDVFRVAFKTLLLESGNVANFSALTSGMPQGVSEIVIQSLEEWIETALPRLAEQDWIEATNRAEEIGKTLEALGLMPYFQIPRRRQQLSSFFWRLEEHCREIIREIIDEEILPALTPNAEPYSDSRFLAVESHARAARRLEILGRHFGNDPAYGENQQRLARAFGAAEKVKSDLGITATDLARLREILLGRQDIS